MKKTLSVLAGFVVALGMAGGYTNAEIDIPSLFYEGAPIVNDAYSKILNEYDNSRWYSDSINIECSANNSISIKSAAIEDSDFELAPQYRLFLSPYRVNSLKNSDPSVNTSNIIMKDVKIDNNTHEVNFNISSTEIDPNTIYYGFISPIDDFDYIWTPSKEICFQLNNVCLQDVACDNMSRVANTTNNEEHNAAANENQVENTHGAAGCVGMDMANISHVVKGDTITLKWTAVEWDDVQIAIFDPEAEVYKNVANVKMSAEKYDYKMQWDGEQNFMLTNGCKEVRYKADAKKSTPEPEIVTPATGPAENILYIAIAAIILYGAYAIFFRKSDNN